MKVNIRRIKKRVKRSWALQLFQIACGPLARVITLAKWPILLARLYGIRLPKAQLTLERPSTRSPANINIILALLRQSVSLPGDVAEAGVYQGASIIPMGLYLKQCKIDKTLYGLDSFEGFPESVQIDISLGGENDSHKRIAGFSDTSYERLCDKIRHLGLDENVHLVKGFFSETVSQLSDKQFCFVHLDVDIYDSYKTCLQFFYPRLSRGGVILFDEYLDPHWPGCTKAIDEFLVDKPEKPIAIQMDNHIKYYLKRS